MSKILEKYNLVFTSNDTIGATSVSPLLSAYLDGISDPRNSANIYNWAKNYVNNSTADSWVLPKIAGVKVNINKVEATLVNENVENLAPATVFTLPVADFLEILNEWQQYVAMLKLRHVTVTDGHGVIDLISDGFAKALVIEKAVAVNWPDCAGSVGEYYSVSRQDYEKQKELTAGINGAMITGSDSEVFEAITELLNLFANGSYQIALHNVDCQWTVMAHDSKILYTDVIEEDRITYGYYPYGETYFLFTRSYNTIDTNRVDYYADLINSGARPRVIVYSVSDYYDDDSSNFVIDGHHKALAYKKLNLNIPTVFIYKKSNAGSQKNIIPQLLDFIKPAELTHLLKEDGNIADIDAYMDTEITKWLDKIFAEDNSIGTTLAQLLYNAYNSDTEKYRHWALQRLTVLGENKNIGNLLILHYKNQQVKYRWERIFIESSEDFNLWKKLFLEDEQPPPDLKERQKAITEKYYPTHYPQQPSYHHSKQPVSYSIDRTGTYNINKLVPLKSHPAKTTNQRLLETMLSGTLMFATALVISPIMAMVIGVGVAVCVIKILIDNERLS